MELKLPNAVTGRVDVGRLLRELNSLEDFFTAATKRPSGASIAPPRLSRMLQQLSVANGHNLLDTKHRRDLQAKLTEVQKKAPQLHISFAADPPPKVVESILVWLRSNIHPHVLLQIGLQPNIAAGCMLRTSNRWFDLSLRASLEKKQGLLVSLLAGANNAGK